MHMQIPFVVLSVLNIAEWVTLTSTVKAFQYMLAVQSLDALCLHRGDSHDSVPPSSVWRLLCRLPVKFHRSPYELISICMNSCILLFEQASLVCTS